MDESGKKTPLLELLRRHGKESSSEAADLIEAQAARIAELEAEREDNIVRLKWLTIERDKWESVALSHLYAPRK